MITTGMLRFVKSDDELALILGHEIAHNALNHIARMRGAGSIVGVAGILLDIGLAAAGMHTGGAIGRAGVNAGRVVFSKEFEMESDYVGLLFSGSRRFDISKAPNFFRRMAVEHSGSLPIVSCPASQAAPNVQWRWKVPSRKFRLKSTRLSR